MMTDELVKNGVTICKNSRVDRIVTDGGKVRGVQVGEHFIESDTVVSNSGILNTINDLAGKEAFPSEFLDKVKTVRVNTSSCQVYIGIKKEEKIQW